MAFLQKAANAVAKTMGRNRNNNVLKSMMSSTVKFGEAGTKAIGRGVRKIGAGSNTAGYNMISDVDSVLRSGSNKIAKLYDATRPVIKPIGYGTIAAVGATAMTSVAVMNGAMSAASDSMATRYMKDSRYSSKVLQNRVGRARGNGSLSIGNHAGLSLSLSAGRHG